MSSKCQWHYSGMSYWQLHFTVLLLVRQACFPSPCLQTRWLINDAVVWTRYLGYGRRRWIACEGLQLYQVFHKTCRFRTKKSKGFYVSKLYLIFIRLSDYSDMFHCGTSLPLYLPLSQCMHQVFEHLNSVLYPRSIFRVLRFLNADTDGSAMLRPIHT